MINEYVESKVMVDSMAKAGARVQCAWLRRYIFTEAQSASVNMVPQVACLSAIDLSIVLSILYYIHFVSFNAKIYIQYSCSC